jgi:hypothetical protein
MFGLMRAGLRLQTRAKGMEGFFHRMFVSDSIAS